MGDVKLRLYNTLTRTKEDFAPLDPANVRMYVCGPTVYDFAHIGNARPAVVFDVLFRLLRHLYGAEHVTYVRNITDVDDKINARALRDFPELPLNEAIRRVTETTAAQYQKDVTALGCLEPTVQPRATDNIAEMQAMVGALIARQNAYEANGEVLFRTASMPDYGRLSGRDLEHNLAGARIAVDAHKENPADFVLWKQSSPEEPGWDSPWGRGRPGWHLECSAMSKRYLGEVFDIHGGGLDLIFPHHENEIAQSRCAHGTDTMARYWLHNGFLQVEGQKMSKSLGNFYSIHQLLETEDFGGRRWPGEVLRLALLMTHYREPIDFTMKRLEEAEANLEKWLRVLEAWLLAQWRIHDSIEQVFQALKADDDDVFVEVLSDDLNVPVMLAGLHGTATDHALNVREGGLLSEERYWQMLFAMDLLGLISPQLVRKRRSAQELSVSQRAAIAARLAALNARDFATADKIRAELLADGIQLLDYKDEAGNRQTKWEVKR